MTFQRPDFIEDIRREMQKTSASQASRNAFRQQMSRDPGRDLFRIKPADQWLKEEYSKPAPKQLLGALWHQHELCILFADTNVGKSILAVQIGYCLAKHDSIEPFCNGASEPIKVLYIDFELSATQFKVRYSHRTYDVHNFGPNFIRAEFNPAGDDPLLYDNYHEYVKENIEKAISQTKPAVLIIDNITSMGSETGQASSALPLMKALKAIKTRHNLSMLVLAHTPKRNISKPITENDLQGSKMLINFADSAFAIGRSHPDPGLRYIKQIKQRNTDLVYGAEHVVLFRISQKLSFLQFGFEGFDSEYNHLKKHKEGLSEEAKQQIAELDRQGLSLQQIAGHLMVSKSTVHRILGKMKEDA